MFKLFSGKISGVLSLALQGITKVVGHVLDAVVHVADTIVETVSAISAPLTSALGNVPVLGDTLTKTVGTVSSILGTATGELHKTAHTLINGDLEGGVNGLLDGVTTIAGGAVKDAAGLLDHVVGLADPLTSLAGNIPVLGGAAGALGQTLDNVIGFVGETGQYVADINPVDLLNDLGSNPLGTVGGVVQDLSGSAHNLVADLSPLVGAVEGIPVLGDIVGAVSESGDNLAGLLGETGAYVGSLNALELVGGIFTDPAGTLGGTLQTVAATVDSLLDDIAPITSLTDPVPVVNLAVDGVGAGAGLLTAGIYQLGTAISSVNLLDQIQLPSFG